MASEWAREMAEKILKPEGCLHDDSCEGPYGEEPCDCWVAEVKQEIAAALDEARREGAERERWECHEAVRQALEQIPDDAALLDGINAIAARGPMRGPEEEKS